MTHAQGAIRDTIEDYLRRLGGPATLKQISQGVINKIGKTSSSSIRSSLNLHVGSSVKQVKLLTKEATGLSRRTTQSSNQKKSRPKAALQTEHTIQSSETKCRTISLATIGHEANPGEAEDHHRPS
jgi:hypothetical protein